MSLAAWEPWEDCETHEYRNPAGGTVRFVTLAGATGRMMPPATVQTLPLPGASGSAWLAAYHAERPMVFPTVFPGSLTDRTELRRWAHVLDPTLGEGTLTVVDGDWAGRQIRCVYDSGLDGFEEKQPDWNTGNLLFRAAWPYWEDALEQELTATQTAGYYTWFPFLPLHLGTSLVFSSFTLVNDGDAPAWPVVTVLGPGDDVTVTNNTTGEFWHVTGSVGAGQTLTVDTQPNRKTVSLAGSNIYQRLTPDSELWPLAPGTNSVSVTATATTTATQIHFAWRRQWLAA